MSEILIGILIGFVVFFLGLVTGFGLCLYAYKGGVRLLDRLQHDMAPFEKDFEEEMVQTNTDGTFEEV